MLWSAVLALSAGMAVGLGLGRAFGWPVQWALATLLGALALGAVERHFGYWQELRPFWRRGGDYLLSMGLAIAVAGYGLGPLFLGPSRWRWGLGVGTFLVLQVGDALIRAWSEARGRALS